VVGCGAEGRRARRHHASEIMAVIKACVDAAAQAAPRVSVVMKLDHRPAEPSGRIHRKVESIEQKLLDEDLASAQ